MNEDHISCNFLFFLNVTSRRLIIATLEVLVKNADFWNLLAGLGIRIWWVWSEESAF